jgi:PqqD family protein of HPr-rel-A system
MSSIQATTAWRVPVAGTLPLRYWNGDCVVYNPLTGSTHVLDIVAGEVLKVIMAAPATSRELCQHVAEFLEIPNDVRTADNVDAVLAALDELGLIEPVEAC